MQRLSSEITWWHFSDLHWSNELSGERKRFLETLINNLERNKEELGEPSFIVVSGDISYSGSAKQFEEAKTEFFEAIGRVCPDQEVPIFVVPGNHDLVREEADYINPSLITSINSKSQLDNFFDRASSKEMVSRPFRAFKEFADQCMFGISKDSLSWSHEIEVNAKKIYVAGINTAWASGYNKNQEGNVDDHRKLLVGLQQFDSLEKPSSDISLSILIMHHPLNWLQNVFENQIKSYIQKKFVLYCLDMFIQYMTYQRTFHPVENVYTSPAQQYITDQVMTQ